MRNRLTSKYLRTGGWIAGLLAVAWLAGEFIAPSEPCYLGRSLTDWLVEAQIVSTQSDDPERVEQDSRWQACQKALIHMQKAAIPILLRDLTGKESKFKPGIETLVRQKRWPAAVRKNLWLPLRQAMFRREINTLERQVRALFGFALLGNRGKTVEPKLIALCGSPERDERYWGWLALTCTTPDRPVLVPLATRLMKDPDPEIRSAAAESLHEEFPDEAEKLGVYQMFPELRDTGKP